MRAAEGEFQQVYGLRVVVIPTRLPCQRAALPTRIFGTMQAKLNAIADDLALRSASGQAVLVGTPSVTASEGTRVSAATPGSKW